MKLQLAGAEGRCGLQWPFMPEDSLQGAAWVCATLSPVAQTQRKAALSWGEWAWLCFRSDSNSVSRAFDLEGRKQEA